MEQSSAVWLVLLCLLLAANVPYLSARLFAVGPRLHTKHAGWLILELAVLGGISLLIGRLLESRLGQTHPQSWEFYVALLCLFLTLGFPGFVWRYLRKRRAA